MNQMISVTRDTLLGFSVHGNTTFTTTDSEAVVRIEREAGERRFVVDISQQFMSREDIKELRKFFKAVLADMKADPEDTCLK